MTASVKKVLKKISNSIIFDDNLYFVGGTALAYYLDHRISEDVDIVSNLNLKYKKIIPNISSLGAIKLQDENITALRLAGLFPDEYMIKFTIDSIKLEFFYANRPIQKEILSKATYNSFENTKLKILDLKSIAKLKIIALIYREKSRDLFDFGAILEQKVLSNTEIVELFYKADKKINSLKKLIDFIRLKQEPKDDEAVYLSEIDKVELSFEDIKEQVIKYLHK